MHDILSCDGSQVLAIAPSVSERNSKLGNIPSFSVLPGSAPLSTKAGRVVSSVPGTCSNCELCEGHCYAIRYTKARPSVAAAYERNTLLLREDPERLGRFIVAAIMMFDRPLFRWNVAGDIDSAEHMQMVANVCAQTPNVKHAIYTHNIKYVTDYMNKFGPISNLAVNWSIEYKPDEEERATAAKYGFQFFAYDNHSGRFSECAHCPAVDENGERTGFQCYTCQRCYSVVSGSIVAAYAH